MDSGVNCEPGIRVGFSDQFGFYPWGVTMDEMLSILGLSSLIEGMEPQSLPCYLSELDMAGTVV